MEYYLYTKPGRSSHAYANGQMACKGRFNLSAWQKVGPYHISYARALLSASGGCRNCHNALERLLQAKSKKEMI